jgi:predicted MFS family arabinose efflux permease
MAIVSDIIPVSRRGAATGTIMTAFSLAAIAGVPAGIVLGAHLGWSSPFYLLAVLSVLIWLAALVLVPSLRLHLQVAPPPLRQVLPALWRLLSNPLHIRAFGLTFLMLVSHMMVIPFISPVLVANHGIAPQQIAWIYMAGGAATFFTSRRIGRWPTAMASTSCFASWRCFPCCRCCLSLICRICPLLPSWRFSRYSWWPVRPHDSAAGFVDHGATSAKPGCVSQCQQCDSVAGQWLRCLAGGLLLSSGSNGQIIGYGSNGWCAVALVSVALWWVGRVGAAAGGHGASS